jgi:glycosyltransferase involved in cell wall biosynthesis
MKPTIIKFIEGSDATGGAEKIGFISAQLLSEAGYRVVVVSSEEQVKFSLPHVKKEDIVCLNLRFLWDDFFSRSKVGMLQTLVSSNHRAALIAPILSSHDPLNTVVHFHGFHNKFSFAAMAASVEAGFRTVLTAHDYGAMCPNSTFYNYPEGRICALQPLSVACLKSRCVSATDNKYKQYRFAQVFGGVKLKRLHKKLDAILSVSPFEQDILKSHWGDLPNLSVLPNPIAVQKLPLVPLDQRKGFLWIGRITEEKDLRTALLAADATQCGLTVIGDGPSRPQLESEFPQHKFLGWKVESLIFDALRASRGLLLTSKWYETASLIALESLALGTPVAIPITCAATSWISPGIDSLTFVAGEPNSLATTIEKLQDGDTWVPLSRKAYENYWNNPYTNERYLASLEEHYARILSS